MKKRLIVKFLSMAVAASMMAAGCGAATETSESKESKESANSSESVSKESAPGTENSDQTQAAGEKSEGDIPSELTLYTYYADSAIEQVDRALEIMKETYPDLKINIEHRTDSDGSVLKTRAAVGELPDIFECTGQLTDLLVKSGDLAELDSVIEETGFFDQYMDGNFEVKKSADGHYYAISSTIPECCLMFYTK